MYALYTLCNAYKMHAKFTIIEDMNSCIKATSFCIAYCAAKHIECHIVNMSLSLNSLSVFDIVSQCRTNVVHTRSRICYGPSALRRTRFDA